MEVEEEEKKPEVKKVQKKRKRVHRLEIISETHSLSERQLIEAHESECKMAHEDRISRETKEKKNELESYVYTMRDKLEVAFAAFVDQTTKANFRSQLDATENWLYGEGEDTIKSVYV